MRKLFFILMIFFISNVMIISGEIVNGDNYQISNNNITRTVSYGSFLEEVITIRNLDSEDIGVRVLIPSDISNYITLDSDIITIPSNSNFALKFKIRGEEIGNVNSRITLSGDIVEDIYLNILISEENEDNSFIVSTELLKTSFNKFDNLQFILSVNLLNQDFSDQFNFSYFIIDSQNNTIFLESEIKNVSSSFKEIKVFDISDEYILGDYLLLTKTVVSEEEITSKSYFELNEHFIFIKLFGFLPIWLIVLIIFILFSLWLTIYLIKRKIKAGKKYSMDLSISKLPKQSEDSLFLGKVAETNYKAYLDPDNLKTHTIVAGATGGGKSISAQVIVEEALNHNVAVIVFDPTAQWSGLLRKCDDKKMISYYSKFGLKPTDAKAFPGNIRMISDARELVDVRKYAKPGQIQIFTMNKLQPKDIDIFVANVIRGIFESDPKESPDLKLLLVFDEVHRLLAKFGGTGEGFLQIERACREFRKWGMGVMLVSQVLSDFMGEIKANINTELQMRTRDEGDLSRIETKYGEQFLKSLVKASVGVGMFTNPHYNGGKPYFINFRPILHNTRRLTDEELEKYNDYNNQVDQIEFEIETIEKKKIDVFDLKMELKLVKDKIMVGNFAVVDIYLQGLKPRLEKQWEKLGEKAPKLVKKLANLEDIKKSVEEAKKSREKYEAQQKKKISASVEVKKEEKVQDKIVSSLTFDNGMMISSLNELKDVLPSLDGQFLNPIVKKNELSNWAKNIDPILSEKLSEKKDKKEIIKIVEDYIKSKNVTKEDRDSKSKE